MLQEIFDRQLRLQTESFGVDPTMLYGEERRRFIVDMMMALQDELHEALAECGWKPWASSKHLNEDAFISELVDALHFLVNLFLVAGADAEDVVRVYEAKANKNAVRQASGYDGVSGKCQVCKRALDDSAVLCTDEVCHAITR